jgi:hypothetical protein
MPTIRRFPITMLFVFFIFTFAQSQTPTATAPSGLTITASAADERVRITAPSSVVQLHVEVYAASGENSLIRSSVAATSSTGTCRMVRPSVWRPAHTSVWLLPRVSPANSPKRSAP